MAIGDIEKAGSSIAQMIIKNKEASAKAKKLADVQTSALSLTEKIKQMGGDSKTADLFAEGISQIKDPETASKLMTAAITNFADQQKSQASFEEKLKLEKYKAGTLAVNEIVKGLVKRGGKFEDGTPITTESLMQVAIEGSDRIAGTLGSNNIAQNINQSIQPQVAPSQQSSASATGNNFFNQQIPEKKQINSEQKKQMERLDTSIANFDSAVELLKDSPQGPVSGRVAQAFGNITGGKYNTKGDLYSDVRRPFGGQLWIGMSGDTRLSDKDAEILALPMMPDQADSTEKNELKIQFIRGALQERKSRFEKGDFAPLGIFDLNKKFISFMSNNGQKLSREEKIALLEAAKKEKKNGI